MEIVPSSTNEGEEATLPVASAPAEVPFTLPPAFPEPNKAYPQKEALAEFFLVERDLDGLPYTSQRNFSGPMPIRVYLGSDLLKAAFRAHGGEEGFIKELSRQARLWRPNPARPPSHRYFVLRGTRETLSMSMTTKTFSTSAAIPDRMMQAFQESDFVVLLFSPTGSRQFLSYGVMQSMPVMELGGSVSTFEVEWNPEGMLNTRDLPKLYEDQETEFSKDFNELPTSLGHEIVKSLAELNFIDHLEELAVEKRRKEREERRERERNRSRSPRRRSRSRSRSPSRKSRRKSRSRSPARSSKSNRRDDKRREDHDEGVDSKKTDSQVVEGEEQEKGDGGHHSSSKKKKKSKDKHRSRSRSRSRSPTPA